MLCGVEMVSATGQPTYYTSSEENATTTEPETYYAKYEPGRDGKAGTLTLNGLNYSGEKQGIYAEGDLNIAVNGTNTVEVTNENNGGSRHGIYVKGNLTIEGTNRYTDRLSVSSKTGISICADNDIGTETLTIRQATIEASNDSQIYDCIHAGCIVNIEKATVRVETSKDGFYVFPVTNAAINISEDSHVILIKQDTSTNCFSKIPNIAAAYQYRTAIDGTWNSKIAGEKITDAENKGSYLEIRFGHTHCVCGGIHQSIGDHTTENEVTFIAWNNANSLPNAPGNYYLTDNVTLTSAEKYLDEFTKNERYCGWEAPDGVVLCLNGHSITMANPQETQGTNKDVDVIKVAGHFTMTDCTADNAQGTITHAVNTTSNEKYKGKGVKVLGGTFDMYGGTITGNTSNSDIGGSGVSVEGVSDTSKASVFNLYGGTITGNTATSGGGVHVRRIVWYGPSAFYMYGGSITNNTVDSNNASYGTGGGVYVSWTSKFVMSGGEISGNTANKFGGGVYASALARDNAYDASDRTAEIVVSGTAKIENNTVNSSANNVYLDSSTTAFETVSAALTIQGSLEGQIGVTAEAAAPVIVATGADPNTADYSNIITSDDSRYEIVRPTNDDTVLMLNGKGASQPSLEHKHCVCGAAHESVGDHTTENEVAFTAWNDTEAKSQYNNAADVTAANSLPSTTGNYYLTGNVTLKNLCKITGDEEITLCLNGYRILVNDQTPAGMDAAAIYTESTKPLTLTDCIGNAAIQYIGTDQDFHTGITTGKSKSALHMYHVTIEGFRKGYAVSNRGIFRMYSGAICHNKGVSGTAGVDNTGKFYMYGGTITDNQTGIENHISIELSGDIQITDNVRNLCIVKTNDDDDYVTIGASDLATTAKIGISTLPEPAEGSQVTVIKGGVTDDNAGCFYADDVQYSLIRSGSTLLLQKKGTLNPGTGSGSSGGGYYTPSTDVTTSGSTNSKVTSSSSTVQNETRSDASGKQETVAKVTVSAANQREILSQAKANKSKSIVIEVAKTAVRNGAKLELNLDKAFIQSILHDTEASLTIRTADGNKEISREKLKTLVAQTEGKTVTIDPEAVSPTDPAEPTDPEKPSDTLTPAQEKIVKGVENTGIDLRSQRTKNGNILLTWAKEKGYKVDYFEIYRSTKRSSGYGKKPFFRTPNGSWTKYLNTKNVKEGSTYYYRIRGVRVIEGKKYYTEYSTKAWRTI